MKTIQQLENQLEELKKDIEELRLKDDICWIKIGNLEWSENLGEMTWEEANKKCEELGGRLPTRIELIDLFDNHYKECQELDNNDLYFWSSTEAYNTSAYAWLVPLNNGDIYTNIKTNKSYVHCVLDLE